MSHVVLILWSWAPSITADSRISRVSGPLNLALTIFNDVILRSRPSPCDLRLVCNRAEDYENPIEPSWVGGKKIAKGISDFVAGAKDAVPGTKVFR